MLKDSTTHSVEKVMMAHGSGGRKTASARAFIKNRESDIFNIKLPCGKIVTPVEFSHNPFHEVTIFAPLKAANLLNKLEIFCTVARGGITGQVESIRNAISKAIVKLFPDLHSQFSSLGFLSRDPRKKEAKKIGYHSARKPHQRAKR